MTLALEIITLVLGAVAMAAVLPRGRRVRWTRQRRSPGAAADGPGSDGATGDVALDGG